METQGADPAGLRSIEEFGAALAALKARSGLSLSRLASATAACTAGGLGRSTLNGYFKGRHLPQQGVGREFRLLLGELGVSEARQDEWWAAVERLRRRSDAAWTAHNPYPGLRSFGVEDAPHFFGRAELVDRLAAAVAERSGRGAPVVVVGPSGSGKSSLLRAGLLPRLPEHHHVVITPGRAPREELAARRADWPDDGRCLLVVDQAEELFAGEVDEAQRREFLTQVWSMALTGAVVLGLRADFYGDALRHPALAAALQHGQVVVPPMAEAELRAAIVEPARTVGTEVDDGLAELLLREVAPPAVDADAAHEQGVLPLLSHALRATFDAAAARDEQTLGIEAYRSTGGIRRAVADTAEAAYAELGPSGQVVARQVLLRLVHVGEAGADTRRVVDREELVGRRPDAEAEELDDILEVFVARRLLTADDSTVQISHEALLQAWPRLRGWLDDDRAGRRVHRRLTLAARNWRDHGEGDEDLYQGATLAAALAWVADETHRAALNPVERDYLEASTRRRDAEQAAARRRVRRRYQLVSFAVVLVVVAVTAVVYARQTRSDAEEAARLTQSRDMAAEAVQLQASDPALAGQIAAAAYRMSPTVEARSALLGSTGLPLPARHQGRGGSANVLAATADLLVTGGKNGAVALARAHTLAPVGPVLQVGSLVSAVAISPGDHLLAAVGENGVVRLWDITNPEKPIEKMTQTGVEGSVASAAFSADGRLLAVGSADALTRVWDTQHVGPPRVLSGPGDEITAVAFAPKGSGLAVGSRDTTVSRYDLTDLAHPVTLAPLTGAVGQVFSVAFSPDGRTLAVGTNTERTVYLWDVTDPARPQRTAALTGPASWVDFVDFSPDGKEIAAGSSDQRLWVWDVATHRVVGTYPHSGVVHLIRYLDPHTIVTLTEDGTIRTWPVPGPVVHGFGDSVYTLQFTASGRAVVASPGARDDAIHLLDTSAPDRPVRVGDPVTTSGTSSPLAGKAALSPDGRLLAGGLYDGSVELWSVEGSSGPTRTTARPLGVTRTDGKKLVSGLEFRAGGAVLAVSTNDGVVTLLDITDPARPRRLSSVREDDKVLNEMHFSPDGSLMATASDDGHAYLYSVADPAHPRRLARLAVEDAASSVAFGPDSKLLAVTSAAKDNVQLWDLHRPEAPSPLGEPLDGPVADIYQIAFNPSRPELAAGGVDGTIWFWDLTDPANPKRETTVTAPDTAVMSIAYSPDGSVLAAGTRDPGVRLWRTDPAAATRWICTATGDPVTEAEWRRLLPHTGYAPAC